MRVGVCACVRAGVPAVLSCMAQSLSAVPADKGLDIHRYHPTEVTKAAASAPAPASALGAARRIEDGGEVQAQASGGMAGVAGADPVIKLSPAGAGAVGDMAGGDGAAGVEPQVAGGLGGAVSAYERARPKEEHV